MLTVIRNEQGQIQVACEWWTVDATGRWYGRGPYIYVANLEIVPGISGARLIRHLMYRIAEAEPQAIAGYWKRDAKRYAQLREYSRIRLRQEVIV